MFCITQDRYFVWASANEQEVTICPVMPALPSHFPPHPPRVHPAQNNSIVVYYFEQNLELNIILASMLCEPDIDQHYFKLNIMISIFVLFEHHFY